MRTTLVLAAVGLGLSMGAPALGQQVESVVVTSSASPAGPGSGRALSRDRVERIGEVLELDELQREVAMELFKEVADKRQALGDAMRQSIESARELADEGDFSEMFTRIKEVTGSYQDSVDALESTFLQDVRAMLTGDQEALWPKAERLHRRGQHMGSLTRSQARVDLDELVRAQFESVYARQDVAEVLDRWAVQVDGLLVERARKAEDIGGGAGFQGGIVMIGGGDDPYEDLRAIDARIVSASEQAVRNLSGAIEDNSIEQEWIRKSFARVYRQTDGERRLEAANALESLTTEQKEQLDAVTEQHGRDVGTARDRWVAAEKEREKENTLPPGVMVMIDGQEPTPSDEARKAVKELDERLEAKLAAILSEDQLAELPAASESFDEVRFDPSGGTRRSIRIGG